MSISKGMVLWVANATIHSDRTCWTSPPHHANLCEYSDFKIVKQSARGKRMPVKVAEYLGIDASKGTPIAPVDVNAGPTIPCPFRNHHCEKAKKKQQPICSVRDVGSNALWIVCEHRFCATTPKDSPLNDHQKKILRTVTTAVFQTNLPDNEILVKREVKIPITDDSDYSADYVMWRLNPRVGMPVGGDKACIVEMQGGGETTGTEHLTAKVKEWAKHPAPTNAMLMATASTAPLVTNAWRRQQEQFLVKGSVAMLTGARMVFCVGQLLYDYLIQRLTSTNLQQLSGANWTLALFAIAEDPSAPPACAPHSIQFKLDPAKTKYTNYHSFVQALTNQGAPQPQVFRGDFLSLSGTIVRI